MAPTLISSLSTMSEMGVPVRYIAQTRCFCPLVRTPTPLTMSYLQANYSAILETGQYI